MRGLHVSGRAVLARSNQLRCIRAMMGQHWTTRALLVGAASLGVTMCAGTWLAWTVTPTQAARAVRDQTVGSGAEDWVHVEVAPSGYWNAVGLARDFGETNWLDLDGPRPLDLIVEVRVGFPFRSHCYTISQRIERHPSMLCGGVTVGDNVLAARLMTAGFLGNAIVVFVCVLGVCASTRCLCTALRRKRRQCPRCAYDLRHAGPERVCPECGA